MGGRGVIGQGVEREGGRNIELTKRLFLAVMGPLFPENLPHFFEKILRESLLQWWWWWKD